MFRTYQESATIAIVLLDLPMDDVRTVFQNLRESIAAISILDSHSRVKYIMIFSEMMPRGAKEKTVLKCRAGVRAPC
jgi:hypothetical protein